MKKAPKAPLHLFSVEQRKNVFGAFFMAPGKAGEPVKKRDFYPEIFQDDKFLDLSCGAKQIALYLMFGEHINKLPVFRVSKRIIGSTFGMELEEIDACLPELAGFGIELVDGYWIVDSDYVSFSMIIGPKNDGPVLRELERLPQEIQERLLQIPRIDERMGRNMRDFVEGKVEIRSWKKEKGEVSDDPGAVEDLAIEEPAKKKVEESIEFLDQLPDEYALQYAEKFGFTSEEMKERASQYANTIRSRGWERGKYKNYHRTMLNWLENDREKRAVKPSSNGKILEFEAVEFGEGMA